MKKLNLKKLTITILVIILFALFCVWQNNDIVISRYEYQNNKINAGLDGYKIAQISDLHNKSFGENNKNLIDLLVKENPNIIVITGDFVDSRNTEIDIALDFAEQALEIAPVYYVSGNHEERLSDKDLDTLNTGLEELGVTILNNKVMTLNSDNNEFYLLGINNKNLHGNTLKKLVSKLDSDKLMIFLAHRPQFIEDYSETGVDLVLSGHAHGGQIRLPFLGGLLAPDQGFFPKYTFGVYEENDTTMIVSRGLGNSLFPVRIFNRPDLVIITLKKGA